MFKVCPSCRQEYQSWASVCADCDVPLDVAREASAAPPLPPAASLILLRLEGPWYLQELAEVLQGHGISSRIDSDPPGAPVGGPAVATRQGFRGQATRLGIYVRAEDLEAAREIDEGFAASRLRDVPATDVPRDPSACPACGERIPETAPSCLACGLEFPEAEFQCPACGRRCAPETRRCPGCGNDFEEGVA
jgi:hypothetical protein